ncbi:peroxiredoxin family protein [Sporosarcina jiandibaonis]|uniref:peroxiredoxin family protein n=1 Tax=Sporosarcina jiandibaonis TaxID=2715535 RepID=UPI0015540BDD|nr:TlpA disulfide reductase family protein [Sporosarcina jiandibaonis]
MNLKFVGMIISIFIIAFMVIITIKTNFVGKDKSVKLEEYPSGLIKDQVNKLEKEGSEFEIGSEKNNVAPDFELKNLSGEMVKLSDYKGKKVFLNFWASWCPPCRVEMPHMENYYKKYKDSENVEIIAVNMTTDERNIENVEKFVESLGLSFPVLLDPEGEINDLYDFDYYPTTYLINADGIIVKKFWYAVDEKKIEELIDNIE